MDGRHFGGWLDWRLNHATGGDGRLFNYPVHLSSPYEAAYFEYFQENVQRANFLESRQREVHAGVKVRAGPVQTAQVRQRGDDHIVGYYRFLMYVISTSSEFPT